MSTAQAYLRPDVIQQIHRLDLRARFIVEGFLAGLHASPYHGLSIEFSEHRKYTPGDDPRLIDWNVYGKTDRFYVKKYRAETNVTAWLLIDGSQSMAYPPGAVGDPSAARMAKFDYAVCLAAALGYLMVHQQDAVGLVCFDRRIRTWLAPKARQGHLIDLLGHLARFRPAGQTQLAATLHTVADRVPRRGLMILFSDFFDDPDATVDALHHLRYRGHDVIAFQVLDVDEVEFPFDGMRRFEDTESSASVTADAAAVRAAYLRELQQFTDRLRRQAAEVQADFVTIHTGMTFDRALIEYLLERQRRF
jgi:uncharacterized protein (DUF58 family)